MRIIAYKLFKDFWKTKGKLSLCVLAACLSAWGISTMVYSYMMSERDFEVNFAKTLPADLEILIDDYQIGLAASLLAEERIIDLERREIVGARARRDNGDWMSLRLFAVEDMDAMRMDVFEVLEGDASAGKLLIETNASVFLDENSDNLEIQFDGDQRVTWKKSGISHDARLAPAQMERTIYAQVTSIDMVEPYLKEGRRRFLIETDVSMDRAALQEVAERIESVVESAGSRLIFVNIPTPGQHIHQNIVDGISFLQESTGLIISGMGVVLLSLILLTWIFPQVSEVGIMKAVGASTQKIFYAYVLVLMSIVFVGLAVGMPLGYMTAMGFNRLIAYVQNFIAVKEILPFQDHLLVVLIGVLLPVLVGSLPLIKASRTTVHQAMNKTFYTPGKSVFGFFQGLVRSVEGRYGVNNLFRNSARTALMSFLMAVGVGLYFTGTNFEHSIHSELDRFGKETKYGIRMRFSESMKLDEVAYLNELSFVEEISPMNDVAVTYRPPQAPFSETRVMRKLSSNHEIEDSFVLEGELDKECSDCLYISGEAMKDEFRDIELGRKITFTLNSGEQKTYQYAGIFKDMAAIGAPFFVFEKGVDSFNGLAFQINQEVPSFEASNLIDDQLLENGIDVAGTMNVDLRLASLEGHIEPTYLIIKVVGLFTMFIGLLSLLIVLNLTIQERTREIGILKSLGSSFGRISGLFQKEFMLVNCVSIVLGVLVAVPLTGILCKVFGETVIYHNIPTAVDRDQVMIASVIVLIVQVVLIALFNRIKLRRNARELLDFNF